VVGDHKARDVAERARVAPAAVSLVFLEGCAAHDHRAGGVDHLLQDGPVLVGRRAGEPVVQLPGTVAERVLTAVVRAGHVPVQ